MNERKLTDLHPAWFSIEDVYDGKPTALQFDCPICPANVRHRMFVPFVDHIWRSPRPVWNKVGDTFEDVTLSPSIYYQFTPCKFHGYVVKGMVTW